MPYLDEYYARVNAIPTDGPAPATGEVQYAETPRERGQDWLARTFASGGAGDIRNVLAALGPAAQAAGGLGQAATWGARAGVPVKAPVALDAADQMFDPRVVAPVMQAAQGGFIDPKLAAILGLTGAVGGIGAYGIYKIKQMMDERNATLQKLMDQAK